ncbi:E3 ubiquitin-protein ligase RNF170-like isoform X1 [Dendrobium catenatum]|uniref:E3 ubiquitin-protein ligase RNF170-like isoform X1 n=1 Tax=Dendrobium catenatum TaxID=906689 RepID=UPI0009F1F067|nr:E3 ubiquitin-protein ligase RNF170-like isoform X1 [Dendrobium catenatum]
MDSPPENDVCSVCHERFTLPCQANCSHWFCGSCIMRVWHHGSALRPCKCPICRRLITLLIPTETSQSQRHEPAASQILENIEKYNRSFGGGSHSIMQRLRDLPFFTRRLLRELMDPQRSLPLVFRARMIFAIVPTILYVLSPIDILPEGVFGLVGFIDDLLILLIAFLHLAALYRSILLYRHGGQ